MDFPERSWAMDWEINLSVIGQYVDYLINEQGVKNVFVNGTTGEGLSLSVQERKQLAEEWAKHAAEIGADGIAVIAPSFFKQVKKDALVAFLRDVASEAPGIPFYYYHIPPLTGIKITAYELLNGMIEQIPTFKGVKFSDKDLLDFGQCVKKNDRGQFVLLYGVDEQLLAALAMGATGAVGRSVSLSQHKPNYVYSEVNPIEFSRTYSQVRRVRLTASVIFTWMRKYEFQCRVF
uniref:N-acetylneuraminate lyase n=1 Tax=Podarcis muralis TaxID=64176 RepID=A0A670HP63_PODMU